MHKSAQEMLADNTHFFICDIRLMCVGIEGNNIQRIKVSEWLLRPVSHIVWRVEGGKETHGEWKEALGHRGDSWWGGSWDTSISKS